MVEDRHDGAPVLGGDPIVRLVEIATKLERAGLSAELTDTALVHIADGLAIIASGAAGELAAVVRRFLAPGRGTEDGPGIGADFDGETELLPRISASLSGEDAAFAMGCFAFADNYGDTSTFSVAHPNTVIVPALLAAAQLRPVSGRRFLLGTVAGYQVMEYLGRAVNNGPARMSHQLRGFRPTATSGPPGAAAAVATAWGLSPEVTVRAISISCNYAAGLRRHSGGNLSPTRIQSGDAARGGLRAVLLAAAGLDAPAAMFDGDGGFFDAFGAGRLDDTVAEYLAEPPVFAIDKVAIKFHYTPYQYVTALDCIAEIARQGPFDAADVRTISVTMPAAHAEISRRSSWQPPTALAAAALDLRFCAAVALRTGDVIWPDTLETHLGDPTTIALASKVEVGVGDEETTIFDDIAGSWPARVVVSLGDGSARVCALDSPLLGAVDKATAELVALKAEKLFALARPKVRVGGLGDLGAFPECRDSFAFAAAAVEHGAAASPPQH